MKRVLLSIWNLLLLAWNFKYKWLVLSAIVVVMFNKVHLWIDTEHIVNPIEKEKTVKFKYLLYDIGTCLNYIFMASCFFWQVKWNSIFLKTFAFWFMLDSVVELLELIINGNSYSVIGEIMEYFKHLVLILGILYSIFRWHKTVTKNFTDINLGSVYLVIKSPTNFAMFLYSFVNIAPGKNHLFIVDQLGNEYSFFFKRRPGERGQLSYSQLKLFTENSHYLIKINLDYLIILQDVRGKIGIKWSLIKNNCYSVFYNSFYISGIRKSWYDIVPALMILKLKKHDITSC